MNTKDARNLFWLMSIQGANAVLPLFIYPYILLKIGANLYSQVAIAESISIFILTFVLFGFDIDGVAMTIRHRHDFNKNVLSEEFSSIFYARVLILFACILFTLFLSIFFSNQLILLTLIWTLVPLGNIFQCSYIYIGFEDNFMIALNTIISRALCIILILLFVHSSYDLYRGPLIIGTTYALGGFCSLIHIITKFRVRFTKISLTKIVTTLINSKEIFFGNLSVILYRDSNLLILGMVSSNHYVISAFSIANKLINAFQAVVRPLNQLFFPKTIFLLENFTKPDRNSFKIISRTSIYQLTVLLFLVFCLAIVGVFLKYHTNLLTQYPTSKEIVTYFLIMLIAVFIGVCNFMFGSAGLNYLSMRKYYAFAMVITGLVTVITGFPLAICFGGIGSSINFILGELLLFILILRKYVFFADNST